MKLVIIEGEGKRETIKKYLDKVGGGYEVMATKGHVRDLPERTLGVDVASNYLPRYQVMEDKKSIVEQLKKRAERADGILLATDPDREGEAISWHLAHILGLSEAEPCRIVFNEISQKAVAAALSAPRVIDRNLVDAQQARRVLDRLVGYKLSPVLCRKIQSKLSGGRVQSVALKLVVEREREILAFVPEEFWTLAAHLSKDGINFRALLAAYLGKKIKVTSKEQMDKVLDGLKAAPGFTVKSVKKGTSKSHAPAPFITSTMQQDAGSKLGLSLKATTQLAQQLYEGIDLPGEGKAALVTYIRTDSTRVAADAIAEARDYIAKRFGADYIPETPNYYKSKKGAQDAHEAIRPISLERHPDVLKNLGNKNLYRLYKLIYDRFLASQMAEAVFNTVAVDIDAADYTFKANGRTPVFDGFLRAYGVPEAAKEEDEDDTNATLPDMKAGDRPTLKKLDPKQKFTAPPPRFTEATLVKAMEDKSIGRPATYTPTIVTLSNRAYTEKEGKFIKPTALGCNVVDMLERYFQDIMDVKFTADMEAKLDEIEDGGKVWQSVIDKFYKGFEEEVKAAMGDDYSIKAAPVPSDVPCPLCGGAMVVRESRFGKFLACTQYPKCRGAINLDEEGNPLPPREKKAPEPSDKVCPKCGKPMVIRESQYGKYYACTGYPKCKTTINIPKEGGEAEAAAPAGEYGYCPTCGKPLGKKKGRFGDFYGCTGYPECRFIA
ncbi:MAG: type I DNA topoisomerase, partial [Clostridiales bacterium]|nr:type I DNA topoisomerase [Clostridiales bacterium]